MTQPATPQTVLAPFDGTTLRLEGVTWRMERHGDVFQVSALRPDPAGGPPTRTDHRIVMVTGSHNYQMYWMQADPGSRMRPFPLIFVLYDRVWIPRKARFLTPPVEWTPDETGRWSVHCIKCHATHGQPLRPPAGETRVAELGISCEACHGPGHEHAARNRSPLRRFRLHLSGAADPTIANPARMPHERATQVCGQCHGIEVFLSREAAEAWQHGGSRYRPGDALEQVQTMVVGRYEDNPPAVQAYLDDHAQFRLRSCFWSDGVLRVAGREYHGMLESPCYQRGEMSCISCHALHRDRDDPRPLAAWADDQLAPGARGDDACLKCHGRYAAPAALAAHTHHAPASSGSRCANCHMPYTSWGLLRAVRSHTIESPDVATSIATGRPNACNQCHLDRTFAWTADTLAAWYGTARPELSEEQRTVAASVLWSLTGDAVQRALMAWSMGWDPARTASGTRWMVPYLCMLLQDPYDAVRFRAQRSLQRYAEYRAVTTDTVAGAPRARQREMVRAVLGDWERRAPSAGDGDPRLLLRPDGAVDGPRFARFAARRNDEIVILFE